MQSMRREKNNERTRGPRGHARVVLVLAWVAFWLNTAFFPCCEAAAAAFGGHSYSVLQAVADAQLAHRSYETQSDRGPSPPCGHSVSAGPESVDAVAALTIEPSPLEWFAIDAPVPSHPVAANYSTNLAPRGISPPPVRPYLRELRLLL